MKLDQEVVLLRKSEAYHRGVVGEKYKIIEIKKTELKLCDFNGEYCFYTHPDNVTGGKGSDYDIDYILKPTRVIKQDASIVFAEKLDEVSTQIITLLKSKNKAYGNSALEPAKIFSKLDATESLCVRIDDKLMRINNRGITDATEDTVDDLIGYLLLLKMSM